VSEQQHHISDEEIVQLEEDLREKFEGRWIVAGVAGAGSNDEVVTAERVGSAPSITQSARTPRSLLKAVEQREQQLAGSHVAPHGVGVTQGVANTRDVPPLKPQPNIIEREKEAI
jgi:hypothetical protein